MSIEGWLKGAVADAIDRGLPALEPLLHALAQSTALLRGADFSQSVVSRQSSVVSQSVGSRQSSQSSIFNLQSSIDSRQPPVRSIEELARRLRAGETTSVETTEACLRIIASKNPTLNAFILTMAEQARRRAREADAELAAGDDRGPLHGVPISLKDLFDVRGVPTTAASNVQRYDVAAADAPAVVQLRHAGAVLIGKTNLHEFAFGTTNEDSAFGAARHPLDVTRSPGGSSGGSAVSVAAGMAFATLGTDTGGSIRIPASACGLVGLKPTVGETSNDGVVPLSRTLDHVGPLAATVTDAWYLHQALVGRGAFRPLLPSPLAGLRVAIPRTYFCSLLEPSVRAAFDRTVAMLERAGAQLAHVDLAHADYIATVYLHIVFAEAAAFHAATLESMPDWYTAPVRLRLEMARYVLAEDYLRAMNGRDVLRREVDAALSWHDALILPTLPIVAPTIGEPTVDIDGAAHPVRNLMLRLTQLFNITGHPAVSLPCGADERGLPIGLQIVGRRHHTNALMRIALGVETRLTQP